MHYGHTESLLESVSDHEERERWAAQLKKAFSKQLSGYFHPVHIDRLYAQEGIYPENMFMENLGLQPDVAVGVRLAKLGEIEFLEDERWTQEESDRNFRETIPERRRQEAIQQNALKDLHSLGVPVLWDYHIYSLPPQRDIKILKREYVLFLPFMKPPEKKGDLPIRDIDGAAIFLAYLLHKGFLKEEDIPQREVEHGQMLKGIGFGSAILTMAKSPSQCRQKSVLLIRLLVFPQEKNDVSINLAYTAMY